MTACRIAVLRARYGLSLQRAALVARMAWGGSGLTPARHDTPRAWVEVRAVHARTGPSFAVYDLTERRDRARLIYSSATRYRALEWALRWAALFVRRSWIARTCFHAASGRLRGAGGMPDAR